MCEHYSVVCMSTYITTEALNNSLHKDCEGHACTSGIIVVSSDLHDDRTFTHIDCFIQGLQQIFCISQVLQLIKEAEVCAHHSPVQYSEICGTLLDTLTGWRGMRGRGRGTPENTFCTKSKQGLTFLLLFNNYILNINTW